jgi:hypothetical protein
MAITETDKLNKNNTIDFTNAQAIIFDRRWDFNINTNQSSGIAQGFGTIAQGYGSFAQGSGGNTQGFVELRVLENPQSQQCQFCWAVGIAGSLPLQYNIDVNGDTYRELGLPGDVRLLVDVANFRASRRQATFDLLIELKLPSLSASPLRIYNDTVHCAIPTTNMVEEQLRAQIPNIAQVERALAQVRALASTSN